MPPASPHLRPAVQGLVAAHERAANRGREVYLGDIPIMLGGRRVHHQRPAERVVGQSTSPAAPASTSLWRIEGVGDRRLHSCRIIPERGSWIELNVTRKESLAVRIRPERQVFHHDADPRDGTTSTAPTRRCLPRLLRNGEGKKSSTVAASPNSRINWRLTDINLSVFQPARGRSYCRIGPEDHQDIAETICTSGLTDCEVMGDPKNRSCSTRWPKTPPPVTKKRCCESISGLRPGNPPNLEKGQGPVHREVLRYESLSPWPRRPASASTASSA